VIVNQGLRFPVRNGTTLRYLSEPEVSAAYRERATGAERQAARVEEIERDALQRLDTASERRWVVVSLVPDLAGNLAINSGSFAAFRQEVIGESPTIVPSGVRFRRASVGRRRLIADGTMDSSAAASWLLLELHADGSGVCCIALVDRTREVSPSADAGQSAVSRIHVEDMVVAVMSGLWQLGRHARDRAAASGSAIVHVQIYPVAPDQQAVLVNTREVAMVIRNLLMRLSLEPDSPQLRVIGTSASLANHDDGLRYLQEFFGVPQSSFAVVPGKTRDLGAPVQLDRAALLASPATTPTPVPVAELSRAVALACWDGTQGRFRATPLADIARKLFGDDDGGAATRAVLDAIAAADPAPGSGAVGAYPSIARWPGNFCRNASSSSSPVLTAQKETSACARASRFTRASRSAIGRRICFALASTGASHSLLHTWHRPSFSTMFRCCMRVTCSKSPLARSRDWTVTQPWMSKASRAHFGITCSSVARPAVDPQNTHGRMSLLSGNRSTSSYGLQVPGYDRGSWSIRGPAGISRSLLLPSS
jgi:hypothetical protein